MTIAPLHRAAWRLRAALALSLLAMSGCGTGSPQFESRSTFPVEGMVRIGGAPAEGVQVFLHPRDKSQQGKPRGVTDAQGRFCLRTYHEGDGAPAGEYTVTLYWPAVPGPNASTEEQLPPDRLQKRFMAQRTSPLRATVGAGPTTLPPIEIK